MNYGLPYKGSKNKLAEKINALFPKKKHFYDLFCGGCAITHRALIENKFETYTINDINPMCTELFMDAIHGKFKNENRWISREDFEKSNEPYVRFCWSFGNNLRDYLYSKELEPIKKAWHYALYFNNFDLMKSLGIDLSCLKNEKNFKQKYLLSKKIIKNVCQEQQLQNSESIERLKSIQSLENLERLERLESLERLEIFNTSFENLKIKESSVIYCDIPYKDTNAYGNKNKQSFDFHNFYEWCNKQKELTFISSYEMPENDFICIAEYEHRSILSANANNKVIEKVFIPKHQKEMWKNSPTRELTLFDDLDDF